MTTKRKKRIPKYKNYVLIAINAAKLSIEMFNRVEGVHSIQGSLIFNAQAWELLAKGILIRKGENIYNKDGSTITSERAINKLRFYFNELSREEAESIMQVISLRNEAIHGILPKIDDEIATHLIYFSLKSFRRLLQKNFKTYFKDFDRNYLSIAFKRHTFYSDKVSKLFKYSRKYSSEKNKLLYLLDRGVVFANKQDATKMRAYKEWQDEIKKLPRKSRVAMHMDIQKYMNLQEDIRFVPVEIKRGFKPEITVAKSNDPLSPVIIKKTDPNIDFPFLTSHIAEKIHKNISFVAKMSRRLKIIDNSNYCLKIKMSKGNSLPKYSEKALQYILNYLNEHPDFNPYK